MSMEDYILNKIDQESLPKGLLDNNQRREKLLNLKHEKIDRFRPDLSEFTDVVKGGATEINQDKQEVRELKELFESGLTKDEKLRALKEVAEIYEGVLVDQIEANAWFGVNCEMLITSEYDDIKNGIDGVGVFKQEERSEYIGFGIDVTFASDTTVLQKKLDSVKSIIRDNKLSQVKYFIDENNKHLSLTLPKVIVGSRLSSAEKLIDLWASNNKNRNQELQQHPTQSKIIMETLWQLHYFYEYAVSQKNNEAAIAYGKLYNLFFDVFEEKKDLIQKHWIEIQDDIVFETIKKYTGN